MKVLHVNITLNTGSTGRIAENLGNYVISQGGKSITAYGRQAKTSVSPAMKIGNKTDQALHLLNTRIFDTHGFHSKKSTENFLKSIKIFNPDIIHLHNLHGYYLNVEVLFRFLKEVNTPVIWTLHDCWAFTGHCCHFTRVNCQKWKTQCYECPLTHLYPESKFFDNSKNNFIRKRKNFNGVKNLTIVTVSKWLEAQVKMSFLRDYPIRTIYNGVDTTVFKPKNNVKLKKSFGYDNKKIVLGVANEWSEGKGLDMFKEIAKLLDPNTLIILIGLKPNQLKSLPGNIIGISRTNNIEQLADYYAMADVFVTPSIAETFGMVVAEALGSGTPCVVNNSTALPELIDESVGIVVTGEATTYVKAINIIIEKGKEAFSNAITRKAAQFSLNLHLRNYYELYQDVLKSREE
jgi:putative colanic acid biosynthesis glycosyltransferase